MLLILYLLVAVLFLGLCTTSPSGSDPVQSTTVASCEADGKTDCASKQPLNETYPETAFSNLTFETPDGCLNETHWVAGKASFPLAILGTANEGDNCSKSPLKKEEICKFYGPSEEGGCNKRTYLVCETEENRTICKKKNELGALIDLDDDGCLNRYQLASQIPKIPALKGKVKYRGRCEAYGTKPEEVCETIVQAPRPLQILSNGKVNSNTVGSCLKPTHLHCDPVMKICLCGLGQDQIRFQYNAIHFKCYIRPTFKFMNGYLCSPGTFLRNMTIDDHVITFCSCPLSSYPPYFDSDNPNWWECKASTLHWTEISFLPVVIVLYNWPF